MSSSRFCSCLVVSTCFVFPFIALAGEPKVHPLWPGKPPGEEKELPPEQDVNKATDKPVGDRKIIKLTNVSIPALHVYAAEGDGPRTAVVVCPGGGHHILAWDHEGTEVAAWLNRIGVTALVLKYRVPFRNPEKRWEAAVQDAQRAVSVVRQNSAEWKINPQQIGILGFSAGGETAALTAILHEQRQYEKVDSVDETSCRPDFAVLVYPGGLLDKENRQLRDYVKVSESTPPMFFAHSTDDPVSPINSVLLYQALRREAVPAEMHIYASGGHGYGMRQTGHPCNAWPDRCAEWMRSRGLVK